MPNVSRSIQPRKQRKAWFNAPLHTRRKQIASHLAETLILKYNRRALPVVKGDVVKVMRGAFRGHEDKVASVDLKIRKVTVEGVTLTKADGKKKAKPIDPSNLLITKLNLTDKLRRERLARASKLDDEQRKKLAEELEKEAKAQAKEIEKFKEELAAREAKEKAERAEEGETQPAVDPVTQKPILKPAAEEKHEHAGGEHLEEVRETQEKKAEAEKQEEKK
ncbi:MAG TPA: 50S ribosomal protein L24 [Candidatus Thermoplasmatota archaeon]|nr:50S ribosomal protein L24 [Candidatus Thermoplasmatota archaeon]